MTTTPAHHHTPEDAGGALPDFLIIGTQRGGTTSLYSYLTQHPGVAPAREKEPFFFDRNARRGTGWYRAQFAPAAGRPGTITGESSTSYLCFPGVAEKAHDLLPEARLIVLLRNPVERAYSSYHLIRDRVGAEPLSFEEALVREEERVGAERQRIEQEGEDYSRPDFLRYSYAFQGQYADHLREWLRHYPREQMLILRSEDLYARPRAVTRQVLEFLEQPASDDVLDGIDFRPQFASSYQEPIHPRTRAQLAEHFEPHNEALYNLLGVDFGWR